MVKFEGKQTTILFFAFIYIPAMALLLLTGISNLSNFITALFFLCLSIGSLAVLALMKSDDQYYQSLDAKNLSLAIILAGIMFAVSWVLSLYQNNMFLSVNSIVLSPAPSSVVTIVLASLVSGLVLVATGEELFKLIPFAEGRARWGKGYGLNRGLLLGVLMLLSAMFLYVGLNVFNCFSFFNFVAILIVVCAVLVGFLFVFNHNQSIPINGVLVYVGFPVGFWAALHGIQSYSNPVMIIPAFVNGVFLIIYLWKTRCILGCIFAHWIYNSAIQILAFVTGATAIAEGTPFFPNLLNAGYYVNNGWIVDVLYLGIAVGAFMFFLLPSLTERKRP